MSSLQHTRLSHVQHRIGVVLADTLSGPWWRRSLLIIGLLVGFLLGNSLTDLLSDAVNGRTFHALMTLIGCELLVALRRRFLTTPVALYWRLLDNLRFGFVYAVVLEAFKVGS